jgi:hypothetical protein
LSLQRQMIMREKVIAALAQLVEHRIRNAGVVGSNPIGGTILSVADIGYLPMTRSINHIAAMLPIA